MSSMKLYSLNQVRDSGGVVGQNAPVKFLGSVTVTNNAGIIEINVGGGASVQFQDEGSNVVSSGTANFKGAGVTVTDVGGVATVTIPGGSSVQFKDSGVNIVSSSVVDFVGDGVTVTDVSGVATVNIPGAPTNPNNIFAVFNSITSTLTGYGQMTWNLLPDMVTGWVNMTGVFTADQSWIISDQQTVVNNSTLDLMGVTKITLFNNDVVTLDVNTTFSVSNQPDSSFWENVYTIVMMGSGTVTIPSGVDANTILDGPAILSFGDSITIAVTLDQLSNYYFIETARSIK